MGADMETTAAQPEPRPMPSTSLLRKWAADPTNEQVWGLDAVADELDRLRRLEEAMRYA